jgi:hypothetical protein
MFKWAWKGWFALQEGKDRGRAMSVSPRLNNGQQEMAPSGASTCPPARLPHLYNLSPHPPS